MQLFHRGVLLLVKLIPNIKNPKILLQNADVISAELRGVSSDLHILRMF